MTHLAKLLKEKTGATAIEYGLIAALMTIVLVAGVGALGDKVENQFQYISNKAVPELQ